MVPVQKHRLQDVVRKHQHWRGAGGLHSSSIDFSISFSLRTNS